MLGDVSHDDAAGADHTALADFDAWGDEGLGGDPGALAEGDGLGDQVEGGFFVIVRAGAEEGALGDADVGLNGDLGEAQDHDLLADPNVVADVEAPGEGDVDVCADDDALADPGSEQAQEGGTQRGRPREGGLKEQPFGGQPSGFFGARGAAIEVDVGES